MRTATSELTFDPKKIPGLSKERMQGFAKLIGANPYIPAVPTLKQLAFIAAPQKEKGYGGAAGGGKTVAALMDCFLPVTHRNYNALIVRRTFSQLSQPDAIMHVAKSWVRPTDARWNERDKVIYFPSSGANIQFGFLEREDDKHRYDSAQFQRVNFEEATQFPWSQYSYLRSRTRRSKYNKVSPSIGAQTNPGGIGHQWFYAWFVKGTSPERLFIPAVMADNKHLNAKEYRALLRDMTEIERAQLERGEWVTDETGKPFKASWWEDGNRYFPGLGRLDVHSRYIFCDTAIKVTKDSALTAIMVLELLRDYRIRVRYIFAEKMTLPETVRKLTDLAYEYDYDGKLGVPSNIPHVRVGGIIIEDKANGPSVVQTIAEGADGFMRNQIEAFWYPGSKEEKWQQGALWCSRDCVELPYHVETERTTDWLFPAEEQIFNVPETEYYDIADVFTMGILYLEELIAWGYRDREMLKVEAEADSEIIRERVRAINSGGSA